MSHYGSVALLWQNTQRDVNPGLCHFELCLLACVRLLANLHFAFHQSKAKLPVPTNEVILSRRLQNVEIIALGIQLGSVKCVLYPSSCQIDILKQDLCS